MLVLTFLQVYLKSLKSKLRQHYGKNYFSANYLRKAGKIGSNTIVLHENP